MKIPQQVSQHLSEHICLYASFDETINADVSRGDPKAVINPKVVDHNRQVGEQLFARE